LPADIVHVVARGSDGVLRVGTAEGLFERRGDRFEALPLTGAVRQPAVYAIIDAGDGGIWVGSEDGVTHIREGRQTRFGAPAGLPSAAVHCLLIDRDGTLWVGTSGGGLCRFRGERFEVTAVLGDTIVDRVWSLFEDREGNLWVGTKSAGLTCLRNGLFTNFGSLEGLPPGNTWSVWQEAGGAVWVGTERGGLRVLEPGGGVRRLTTADGLLADDVAVVVGDGESVWVGTDVGLNRVRDGAVTAVRLPDGSHVGPVRALLPLGPGDLWVGTVTRGLLRFSSHGVGRWDTGAGLPDNWVHSIVRARDETLWVGTNRGIAVWRDGVLVVPHGLEPLSRESVYTIHEGPGGVGWGGHKNN
jgi:ligand-binding sensor domain-containing protein